MPSAAEEPPTLDDALDSLHEASRLPAKQRTIKVSSVVDVLCSHAIDRGLDQDILRDIVQLASVKTSLDQTSVTTLIKNLYLAQQVPGDVVVTIVGALGQGKGKPSPSTQDSFVKWLVIVHEIIDDASILSRLYGVLFGMLDMISIRTSLCHLLSLITRRKHVKPFRIQQLLELSRGIGNEPALQGLLRVYKDYYPDIILGSTSTSRKSFAPETDPEWRTRITSIQNASIGAGDSGLDIHNGFKVVRRGPRSSKVVAIPDVHTFHATEISVTLEGIDNVNDFVEKLDRIEPPGQLISLLTDPLLQKYIELRPSPITTSRIDLWLATCLEEQYECERLGNGDPQYLSHVLEGLSKYSRYTKTIHPVALAFLKEYLPIWNGRHDADAILGLLSRIPIEPFAEVYSMYLSPVDLTLSAQDASTSAQLFDFYTSLVQHQVFTGSTSATSTHTALNDLVAHVGTLSTSILLSLPSPTSVPLASSILSFYEVLSSSCRSPTNQLPVIPIMLPPVHLVYLLAQNASLAVLSRICGILGAYKIAFDQHPRPVKRYYPAAVTDMFNVCLRDNYNLLWVSKALIVAPEKSIGMFCAPELRAALHDYLSALDHEYAIEKAFVLSSNPWLASVSATAWRAIENDEIEKEGYDRDSISYHNGPVSKASLELLKLKGGVSAEWDGPNGYKVFVLRWLDEHGLDGIKDLMFAIATNLRGKK